MDLIYKIHYLWMNKATKLQILELNPFILFGPIDNKNNEYGCVRQVHFSLLNNLSNYSLRPGV
jgi:hypothetical protein